MNFRISIFKKFMILNSIIFLVMLFVLFLSFFVFGLYDYQKNTSNINQIIIQISKYRLNLINQKDENFKMIFINSVSRIEFLKREYKNNFLKINNKNDFSKINTLINDYCMLISEFTSKLEEIGLDEESGLEKKFREDIHNVENYLNELNQNELQILQLQLRRREKDFIIRGKSEYKEKFSIIVDEIYLKIENSGLSYQKKEKLKKLIKSYSDTFLIYSQQKTLISSLHKKLNEYEEKIHNQLSRLIKDESILIAYLKKIIIIIIIISTISTYIIAYFITKRIVFPINKSVSILNLIAVGKINQAKEEIELLEKYYYK